MKKPLLFILLLWLSLPSAVRGQRSPEPRHSFTVTAGFAPFTDDMESYDWFTSHDMDWYDRGIHDVYDGYGHPDGVYYGALRTSGALSLTYGYQLFRWMRLTTTLTHTGFYRQLYRYSDGQSHRNISRHYVYIMPGVTFTYLNRPVVRLFSSACLGVGFIATKDRDYTRDKVFVGGQSTLFGIEVGRKLYGTAEVGFGMKGVLVGGVGYRF